MPHAAAWTSGADLDSSSISRGRACRTEGQIPTIGYRLSAIGYRLSAMVLTVPPGQVRRPSDSTSISRGRACHTEGETQGPLIGHRLSVIGYR
jgi:hypothetical protein